MEKELTSWCTNIATNMRLPKIELGKLIADKLVVVALPNCPISPDLLASHGARDVLILLRNAPPQPTRCSNHVVARYKGLRTTYENNCSVAILHGISSFAITSIKALRRFETILIPFGPELASVAASLPRFRRRDRLQLAGTTVIRNGAAFRTYLVLSSSVKSIDNRRQYAPAGISPLEIVRRLEGLDYIVLRWSDAIAKGTHTGDIDLLVSADSVDELKRRFSTFVGTFPLDVYTDDGSKGHFFNQVPYYMPSMARRMLQSATVSPAGVRVASAKWQFLSFGYHLLFHIKSRRVPPGTETLSPTIFPNPKYFWELQRLAIAASEKAPQTFGDIEESLKKADAFPSIDLIGFYSNKNRFLKERYFNAARYKPGLMTVFVRDYGRGLGPVRDIRATLSEKFAIIAEGKISPEEKDRIMNAVRGGNWLDPEAPGSRADPVYWFICWDKSPCPPRRTTRRKYPRLDNEHALIKLRIRSEIGRGGYKPKRLVHASDNTAEALEHIKHLGLHTHPEVLAVIKRLERDPAAA